MKHSEGFLKLVDSCRSQIVETNCDEVNERLKRGETITLIDIREESEWNNGHIRGAIYLGKGIIERDIENLIPNKSQEIILYCGGGYRSAIAAKSLMDMNYTNVKSMDGGIRVWREKNYPTN